MDVPEPEHNGVRGSRVGDFDRLNPRAGSVCVLLQPACCFDPRAGSVCVLLQPACCFGMCAGSVWVTAEPA